MKMMNNLFSIFDPSTSPTLSLNWLSMLLILLILPYNFWIQQSRYMTLWLQLINLMLKEFNALISSAYSNLLIFCSLFILILSSNFLGLVPYIFTSSSHMSFCLSLSLPLWLGMILFSIINYFNIMCAHLTPEETPFILMPFMVIIESISLIIRPLTLAVRLTANMIAGHLLLTLLGSSSSITPDLLIPLLTIPQTLLLLLELAVSMIQAYVFSVLSTLYSNEN